IVVRGTAYPWTALSTALFLAALAFERSVELLSPKATALAQFPSQLAADSTVILVALLLPLLFKPIYRRPKLSELKRTYKEQEYSQRRLTIVMDAAPMMAFIKDNRGRYVYMSQFLADAFGIHVEDALGKVVLPWASSRVSRSMRKHEQEVLASK